MNSFQAKSFPFQVWPYGFTSNMEDKENVPIEYNVSRKDSVLSARVQAQKWKRISLLATSGKSSIDAGYDSAKIFRRKSTIASPKPFMASKMEPTYKLEPDTFPIMSNCQKVADDVITSHLEDYEYEEETCRNLCIAVSDEVKRRIRLDHLPPRFKLVVNCFIGEKKSGGQNSDVFICSRNLLSKYDRQFDVKFSNDEIYCVLQAYFLYFE